MELFAPLTNSLLTIVVSVFMGFMLGKSAAEKEADNAADTTDKALPVRSAKRAGSHAAPKGRAICSPATGNVGIFYEGDAQGAVIQSTQGKLFAPLAGKITRVYPMGYAFVLRASDGLELLLQAGNPEDELYCEYYRPRVLCNEVVPQGKLLLEYDRDRLMANGVDTSIYVRPLDTAAEKEITLTQADSVKVGEKLLWIG